MRVSSTTDAGSFRGRPYQRYDGRMEGTAPGGGYSVPVTVLLPANLSDGNGFSVVDVLNTVAVGKDSVLGPDPLPLARHHIGDDYLFGTGHAYVGVLWDKGAAEALGAGMIAQPADGYTILADAAELARAPRRHLGMADEAGRLKVVAFGFSQTGAVLRDFYFSHHNSAGGTPVFDAAIVGGAGGACFRVATLSWDGCEGPLADGGKVISVLAEGDAQMAGGWERGENPDYRFIEVAGVSHIPATINDFRGRGLPEQNPIGFEPVMRAALANIEAWLDGTEPPPSIALELSDAAPTKLNDIEIVPLAVDGDGNALGGLRLPHMAGVTSDGRPAGAPLGRYGGLASEHADNFFLALGGTFTPFPPDKVKALYPTHAAYVGAVKAAVDDLVARRYILPEDGTAYVEAAERANVGAP
ncbi:MAG: alpha/beta hydrolase domain-containing protein [Geminicoccaceae bacterium]